MMQISSNRKKKAWKATREGLKMTLYLAGAAADGVPIPGAKAVTQILLRILENIDYQIADSNMENLKQLTIRIERLRKDVYMPLEDPRTAAASDLQERFQQLNRDLEFYAAALEARRTRSLLARLSNASTDAVNLKDVGDAIDKLLQDFLTAGIASITRVLAEFVETARLEKLPRSNYASYKSERPGGPDVCFENTREDILHMLEQWIHSVDAPRIFWLHGQAGIGKSTIAHTFAKYLDENNILGASFVFQRSGHDSLKDAKVVFPTLAYQLAYFDPKIKSHISVALHDSPNCHSEMLDTQFEKLILIPLCKLVDNPMRVIVIVLDALDECEPEERSAKILSLFFEYRDRFPFNIRILVTSRPEHHIRNVIPTSNMANALGVRTLDLHHHDINEGVVGAEITQFLRKKLTQTWNTLRKPHMAQWPPEPVLRRLVVQSGQLFVYAATIVRFIGDDRVRNPKEQLKILLKIQRITTENPFATLDKLYLEIIQNALSENSPEYHIDMFKRVVGSVVLLRTPLSITALAQLLGNLYSEQDIRNILYHLHSVIIVPETDADPTLRVYHLSFANFITDPSRCSNTKQYINSDDHELHLFRFCISILKEMFDNQDKDASDLLEQYCCNQWSNHLRNVSPGDPQRDRLILDTFASLERPLMNQSKHNNVLLQEKIARADLYHWKRDAYLFDPNHHAWRENEVQVEFYKLTNDVTGRFQFIPTGENPLPTGENLCINNRVNIAESVGTPYGLKLINSRLGPSLYPYVYCLDGYDFSITDLYCPPEDKPPPLTTGGELTIGYGLHGVGSGVSFFMETKDRFATPADMMRIILSTEPISIAQFMDTLERQPFPRVWGIVDIPIIQHPSIIHF